MQCSVIIEDLVQQIVDRGKEEMLRALPTDDEIAAFLPSRRNSYVDFHQPGINGSALNASNPPVDTSRESQDVGNADASGVGETAVYQAMASLQEGILDVPITMACSNSTLYSLQRRYNTKSATHHSRSQP